MGYIEELAAKEAVRQQVNAAKQAEMARVMNQGQAGLAATVADPYAGGLSQEDAYKLQLVQKAREANAKAAYDKLAADRFNASKQYQDDARLLKKVGWNTPEGAAAVQRSDAFDDRIDPGLAAKWMADREAFK